MAKKCGCKGKGKTKKGKQLSEEEQVEQSPWQLKLESLRLREDMLVVAKWKSDEQVVV